LFYVGLNRSKAENYSSNLNQLFKPTAEFGIESSNYIETDLLYSNKFQEILINETIGLLKKKGIAKFYFKKFNKAYSQQLLSYLNSNFVKEYCDLYSKKRINDNEEYLDYKIFFQKKGYELILKKKKSFKLLFGNLDYWTFGIVTNGKRDKILKKIINSILNLKIPKFEIIICGKTNLKFINKNIHIMNFAEKDDKGWITKKKNLIVNKSIFENICIIHDRVLFEKKFWLNFKKWGNYFFHLSCTQNYKNKRTHDWVINNINKKYILSFLYMLDKRDWNENCIISGQIHIGKKFVFKKFQWDEKLFWNQSEDVEISKKIHDFGYLNRFNPYSCVNVDNSRFLNLPFIRYNEMKLSNKYYGNYKMIIGRLIYQRLYQVKNLQNILLWIYKLILKFKII